MYLVSHKASSYSTLNKKQVNHIDKCNIKKVKNEKQPLLLKIVND